MAYFDCIVGGSVDGSTLIVTCYSGFAGLTISITNGVDTFSDVCPSTSPYEVVFEGLANGTWTLSTVYNGTTYTKTVEIALESIFYPVPDGATVTPVNDIQTWLHCADIWDKNYTTISQVLADVSTLQALIASNNAADYMARSTSWASSVNANSNAMTYIGANDYCANKLLANSTWCTAICNSAYFESVLNVKVPTMTSNTTPSGQCSAISSSSYPAWYAFDNNGSTYWWVNTTTYTGNWIQYMFAQNVKVRKVQLIVTSIGSGQTWELQGSNDGNNFTPIKRFTTTSPQHIYITVNNTAYKYYRWHCVSGSGGSSLTISAMQIYGRA